MELGVVRSNYWLSIFRSNLSALFCVCVTRVAGAAHLVSASSTFLTSSVPSRRKSIHKRLLSLSANMATPFSMTTPVVLSPKGKHEATVGIESFKSQLWIDSVSTGDNWCTFSGHFPAWLGRHGARMVGWV